MSETDEIAQQTGRTFRDVLTVAGEWLRTLRHFDHGGESGRPKRLTRRQKRELGEHIMAQLSAQRVTGAWYTKRVADYRAEHAEFTHRRDNDPLYTAEDRHADYTRLHAMRLRIEEGLPGSALAVEHRGQVVMALDQAERDPHRRDRSFDEVFAPLDENGQREARAVAVESEQWVTACRQDAERMAASMRLTDRTQPPGATTPEQRRATTSGTGAGARQQSPLRPEVARINAIQEIRHVEYKRRHEQANGQRTNPETDAERRRAADHAVAAGMTVEQIRWEFAHADTNSRCQVTVSADAPDGHRETLRSYHPSEAEAAQFTRSMVRTNWWREGTQFTVQAREAGRRHSFYLAEGDYNEISDSVGTWQRDLGPAQTEPPDRDRAAGDDVDPDRRVTVLQRSLDAVTKDRDDTRQQLATVTAELETVKNTQLVMNNEMKALREQVAAVTTERDRYRGERDEAVRKVAQATPERDRYGSRERVEAEQAANGDGPPKARRTAPRSR